MSTIINVTVEKVGGYEHTLIDGQVVDFGDFPFTPPPTGEEITRSILADDIKHMRRTGLAVQSGGHPMRPLCQVLNHLHAPSAAWFGPREPMTPREMLRADVTLGLSLLALDCEEGDFI